MDVRPILGLAAHAAVVAERDGTLRQLQTERFHLSEDLAASREQIAQLQEQRCSVAHRTSPPQNW